MHFFSNENYFKLGSLETCCRTQHLSYLATLCQYHKPNQHGKKWKMGRIYRKREERWGEQMYQTWRTRDVLDPLVSQHKARSCLLLLLQMLYFLLLKRLLEATFLSEKQATKAERFAGGKKWDCIIGESRVYQYFSSFSSFPTWPN